MHRVLATAKACMPTVEPAVWIQHGSSRVPGTARSPLHGQRGCTEEQLGGHTGSFTCACANTKVQSRERFTPFMELFSLLSVKESPTPVAVIQEPDMLRPLRSEVKKSFSKQETRFWFSFELSSLLCLSLSETSSQIQSWRCSEEVRRDHLLPPSPSCFCPCAMTAALMGGTRVLHRSLQRTGFPSARAWKTFKAILLLGDF